jgi:hypothetical protein
MEKSRRVFEMVNSRLTKGAALSATMVLACGAAWAAPPSASPDFGPNVIIFDPSMQVSQIQTQVDSISARQLSNQFGTQRYALLFKPGVYGSPTTPLNFQVGYYTSVAGLGQSPNGVTIDGSVNVYNQCDSTGSCVALNNFWRSLSNLTVSIYNSSLGCHTGEFWAVSQAAPMRRVSVTGGNATLMDYCTGPSFASGGFIADSTFAGGTVINGSQQQWFTRNSSLDGWTNGVWNQVFSGVVGAPAECFPGQASCGGPYTTVAASPVTREEPYLYIDTNGGYNVFVPTTQTNSVGPTWWAGHATPGYSIPINRFYIAKPTDPWGRLNGALQSGMNLILTPGVYNYDRPLSIRRPDTVVLGLGFATLVPQKGNVAMSVETDKGVLISGILFDAGPMTSPALLTLGGDRGESPDADSRGGSGNRDGKDNSDPSALHDVFFRIGGAAACSVKNALVVNSDNAILDDVWVWRADHGNGVGWTLNTADTGLIVNGANVAAYGLFVEHFQKDEVLWNGDNGLDIFFQNEMPYDPPSQAAWMQAPGVDGYPAFKVGANVKSFKAYGMGSYSFFNQGVNVYSANAFQAPTNLPPGSFHDLLTVFLNASASGGILNVINNMGGSSTAANPDTPVTVVNYP